MAPDDTKTIIVIVDDEEMSREALEHYVSQIDNLNLIASCKDGIEALKVLEREEVELIFLDVEMPEMSGIELLKKIEN